MKKVAAQTLTTLGYLIFLGASSVFAGGAVVITEPANDATISSPVKVCMEVHGIEVEPAAALGIAALRSGNVRISERENVALVICGANST